MYSIGRFINNFKELYNDINGATLTGAIDVVVVEQEDGTYNCSPFHVRFGKIGVLRSKEKVVDIEINGEPQDIHMKLGESGEAFFVEEIAEDDPEEIPEHLATSPIPVSQFEQLYQHGLRRNSFNLGENGKCELQIENQVNDYTKRRYTAESDNEKTRHREFLQRQITLGNIEDKSIRNSPQISTDDIRKDNGSINNHDDDDTIFKMDECDGNTPPPAKSDELKVDNTGSGGGSPSKVDDPPSESRSGKKKRRKKSILKKKNAQRKTSSTAAQEPPNIEVTDVPDIVKATNESSGSSSQESTPSGSEPKIESEMTASSSSRKMTLDPDFHFFSDTEVTTSQVDSRPNTPVRLESVQSDTEFEVQKSKDDGKSEHTQNWAWGEFPTGVSQPASPLTEAAVGPQSEQEHNSMLSNMFSFMKQGKHRRHSNNNDGIYLSDISSGAVDPEVAALYFSQNEKKKTDADMDCESGNGPSLTQSPNSVEGSKSIDSDFEEHQRNARGFVNDISISMCGWESAPTEDSFVRNVIAFTDLCNNPSLLESPNLVVRINGKYYNWKVASPIIATGMIYQRPLPESTIDQLMSIHMPATMLENTKEPIKQESSRSWWNWGKRNPSRESLPPRDSQQSLTPTTEIVTIPELAHENTPTIENASSSQDSPKLEDADISASTVTSEKYKKSLRLSSEQIAKLNLRDGMNEVEFSVTTAYQGTTRCKCHLYKWRWDDKIVISDIDGTITKSDVLGHILPIVGKDWAQSGVAQLFNKIKDNGYKLLYLSARAIGQARITREYLKSIKQGDLSMPDGPLLLNPTSLITAFHREVIEKKPEQFKISCMSDIRALFPTDACPFYAGYGNRINDVWAYTAVGIPIVRIFTINPKGELKHELTQTFQSSYSNMTFLVDHLFPPLLEAANDYSQFIYWRDPVAIIDDLADLLTAV